MWLVTIGIMMQTSRPWTRGIAVGEQQALVRDNAFRAAGMYGATFVIAVGRFIYCSTLEERARRAGASKRRGNALDEDGEFFVSTSDAGSSNGGGAVARS